ncbi:MAG: DUF3137 domain-containing protein [Burkholderiales bacterium]|jgi:hypothetical protein|nr:DUF3137 domain-containing protein [Burkholderiales bacterium]
MSNEREKTNAEAYAQAQQAAKQIIRTMIGVRLGEPDAAESAPPYEPDAALDAILVELETVRQQAKSEIAARAIKYIPIGALLGFGLSLLFWGTYSRHGVFGLGDLLQFVVVGALLGFGWSVKGLYEAYRQLYKQRVLPKLAAGFGLDWRPAQPPLDEFKRYHLFPRWDDAQSADEICGDYRGMPLSIFDLDLFVQSGKQRRAVFNGVVVALTLPRGLRGITVVAPQSLLGGFTEHLFDNLQSVHLENPEFAKAFQVHASDQVSARALLTPAFMERFLELASAYGTPQALAEDRRFFIALPVGRGSLFSPPSFNAPATARETLTRLHQNIVTYLHTVDAVIDLDQAARQQAQTPSGAAAPG